MKTFGFGFGLVIAIPAWAGDLAAPAVDSVGADTVAGGTVTASGALAAEATPVEAQLAAPPEGPLDGSGAAALASDPTPAPQEAPRSLVAQAPLDRARASLRAEADAMAALVVVLKKEVREGRLDMSTKAKLAWQAGVVDFDNVDERADVGDWSTAWLAAIQARTVVLAGADEAFSVRTAEPVTVALQDYLDAVEPRVEAVRQILRIHGRDDLEKRWIEARELFQQAKTQASVDRLQKAWGALVVSSGKLDQLLLQTVWNWHPDAG